MSVPKDRSAGDSGGQNVSKLAFILGVSFGSLILGYLVRRLRLFGSSPDSTLADSVSKNLKLICTFVLSPIPIFDAFWRTSLNLQGLVVFPLLGLLSLAIGAGSAMLLNRLFHIPPHRAASVFVSGMFTNIVSFGGLVVYVFFGYEGYGLVQLFNMFVAFTYYAVGFPVSEQIGLGRRNPFALSPKLLVERPYIFIPMISMMIGLVFNLLRVPHLPPLDRISSLLIPTVAGLMGFSIGLTMFFGKIRDYRREITIIAFIKFLIVPLLMLPIGLLIGLPRVMDGLAFKVLVVLSFMPVAFNALVPPALYGFDLDLANSGWIVTTLALIVIVPALLFTLGA